MFVRVRVCSVLFGFVRSCSGVFGVVRPLVRSFGCSVESVRFFVDPPLAARPCYASEISVAA